MEKDVVKIFYTTDENYIPFLNVSILSMRDHISKDRQYKIHILNVGLKDKDKEAITCLAEKNFDIEFVDAEPILNIINGNLPLRDYYSYAIYFRLFIAQLFPDYDKAVYIDTDTVLTTDVAELYDKELGENIVGAAMCAVVDGVDEFVNYAKKSLGLEKGLYFSSGVLLINLKLFRDLGVIDKFFDVAKRYGFLVAPDQDYLNVMCRGRVLYLGQEWNSEVTFCPKEETGFLPKLIHYALTAKPWHYDNVPFGQYFWDVAKRTKFYEHILSIKESYSDEMKKNDDLVEKGLVELAVRETQKVKTYFDLYGKTDCFLP